MRYYFHTDHRRDLEGIELPSLTAAKCHAMNLVSKLVCDDVKAFFDMGDLRLTITSETGLSMFQLEIVGTDSPSVRSTARSVSA